MRDMDDTPRQRRRRKKVSASTLLETAQYIADSWEQDRPGGPADDSPEKVQAAILDFMRNCGIQTIEDYENFLIKDHQTK